jgi:hypothetical protein
MRKNRGRPVQKGGFTMKRITAALAVSLLLCVVADARPVKWWRPGELWERSEAVVLATPVSIEKTKEAGQIRLGNSPPLPVVTYKATLSVKCTIKGEVLKRMEFRYSPLDRTRLGDRPIVNGPGRIRLEKGAIYVFYLRKQKRNEETFFVGALEGQFDDEQAVVLVAPQRAEQGAPADADKPRR